MTEYVVTRVKQLEEERSYWQGVQQRANAELLDRANRESRDPDHAQAAQADNTQELKAQAATAAFLQAKLTDEIERLQQLRDNEARETAALGEHEKIKDLLRREEVLKEQLAKDELAKAEIQRKDEQIKAEALRKDEALEAEALRKEEELKAGALAQSREKDLLAAKEAETAEALAKEEQTKAQEQREMQSDSDLMEIGQELQKEMDYVIDEIGKEWDYVDKEIRNELVYSVGEALKAAGEAGYLLGVWLANPVNQKEAKEFVETQTQEHRNLAEGEVFQAAPAAHKTLWLEDMFKEQLRAVEEKFGGRKDDFEVRETMQQGLKQLHETLLAAVEQERKIEREVNAQVEDLKKLEAQTAERLANSKLSPDDREKKLEELHAVTKREERELRDDAESRRAAVWKAAQERAQEIEQQLRTALEAEDAHKRAEAEKAAADKVAKATEILAPAIMDTLAR